MYTIYIIGNTKNGNKYVGCTSRPNLRRSAHFSKAKTGKHASQLFNEDYEKYGREAFIFLEVEQIEEKMAAFKKEKKLIQELLPAYNKDHIPFKPTVIEGMSIEDARMYLDVIGLSSINRVKKHGAKHQSDKLFSKIIFTYEYLLSNQKAA